MSLQMSIINSIISPVCRVLPVSCSLPRFGDLFGAQAALSLSCGATIVFFLLLASAEHPAMLFIHKLPTLFMHVLPASQMVVTDLSDPDRRADSLSKLGLCFGIGMIAGSTLGGHLNTRYGSVLLCVAFSLLLVLKFIPKTTKAPTKTNSEGEKMQSCGLNS
uniref:Major facilitator superfamily (MFS) profile domain-containing protein n=1 Tax=Periophthalmus magnuspinnatus TaxID=409849 RepID=A0A3B4B3B5_9GOBI